jgi:hypothetical protein
VTTSEKYKTLNTLFSKNGVFNKWFSATFFLFKTPRGSIEAEKWQLAEHGSGTRKLRSFFFLSYASEK